MNVGNEAKSLLCALCLAGALLSTPKTRADDFLIGTHGPTDWQLDDRITYSEKKDQGGRTDALIHTTVVKHWTGDRFGWFGMGILPYKNISKNNVASTGLGDLTLKFGPRGYMPVGEGSFHWITTLGMSFPTGNEKIKPTLGTGGYDPKVSFTTTYLSADKKNELTTSSEYTIPQQKTAKRRSDDITFGWVAGRKINEKWRLGVGATSNFKNNGTDDGKYTVNIRLLARCTFNKDWHTEFLAEQTALGRNMPRGFTVGTFVRYNF